MIRLGMLERFFSRIAEPAYNDWDDLGDYQKSTEHEWLNYSILVNAFYSNKLEVVESIIRKHYKDASKSDYCNTLLHFAISENEIDVIKILLNKRASIKIKNYDRETPLHLAFYLSDNETVNKILRSRHSGQTDKINPNPTDDRGLSHMHIACTSDDKNSSKFVQHFLKQGIPVNLAVNLNSSHWPGYTPLHFAVKYCNIDTVKLLLEHGADINITNKKGFTPLHIAFFETRFEILDLLLTAQKSFVNNVYSRSPILSHLHMACYRNNLYVVQGFLDHDADINDPIGMISIEYCNFTLLHIAVTFEYEEMVKLLTNYGADITIKDAEGFTPLHLAFKNKSKKMVDLLLVDEVYPVNYHPMEMQEFLNPTDKNGLSHFHIACIYNKVSVIENFLQCGVSIDTAVDSDSVHYPGYTALHFAAEFERLEAVQLLLKWHANVCAKDIHGFTPLHIICQQSISKVLHLIEENHVVKNEITNDQYQNVVLDMEKWLINQKQYIDIINLLIKHCSSIACVTGYLDYSPLYYACQIYAPIRKSTLWYKLSNEDINKLMPKFVNRCFDVINLLLENNADVCKPNQLYCKYTDETLLFNLISTSDGQKIDNTYSTTKAKIVELLLSKGANVNATGHDNLTLLHVAAIDELSTEVVEVLLKYNVEVNAVEKIYFATPLHQASRHHNLKVVQMLIRNGANVNARSKDGKTALHDVLCSLESLRKDDAELKIIELLLEAGCDVNVQDNEGKTPLHVASSSSNISAVNYLLQNGADINIKDNVYRTPIMYLLSCSRSISKEIFYAFEDHINKLKMIGYQVIESNMLTIKRIRKRDEYSFIETRLYVSNQQFLSMEYQKELDRMKCKKLGKRSLYDILRMDSNQIIMYAKDSSLKKIVLRKKFKVKYPFFGYFLKLQYKKACTRLNFFNDAKDSFELLLKFSLPGDCAERIFRHLNNQQLNNVIKTRDLKDE